jgi:HAD superfamily hydrolase (TIGR01509 family)
MAPPSLVIFDCDGVLVDSEPLSMRVLLETVRAKGVELDHDLVYDRFLGRSLASICRDLDEAYGVMLDAPALADLRRDLYAAFEAELQPTTGIVDALPRLALPFCVASSSQPERIELSLKVTGLWPRFAGRLFSATMVARGKPAPDLFEFAAARMGHPPATSVVVEDSAVGIQAARAAGMRVVGFLGGSHARRPPHRVAIEAMRPDAVIDDMALLPDLLAAL